MPLMTLKSNLSFSASEYIITYEGSFNFCLFNQSTYYGIYPGGGACALDPPSPLNKQPDWIMVAAGEDDYQQSLGCGMCIEITANGEQTDPSTGGPTPMNGTYKAYIGDLCGGCKHGGLTVVVILNEWYTSFFFTPIPQHLRTHHRPMFIL